MERREYFDAAFWGYTPMEAELTDPQVRKFHECAWGALENAGYGSGDDRIIGLYAGASGHFDWEARAFLSASGAEVGRFAASLLSDRDFMCTRIAHKLNLRGPVIHLQTACSTSLTAIHLACQGILNGECDMALAGGVSIGSGKNIGYIYREGMISSPDGHCRAFDARSRGGIGGKGAAVKLVPTNDNAARLYTSSTSGRGGKAVTSP